MEKAQAGGRKARAGIGIAGAGGRKAKATEAGSEKAQASTEHLILLAAVLIVAMIAVMLLTNGQGRDVRLDSSKNYWGNTYPIAITESFREAGQDVIRVRLKNTGATTITIDSFEVWKGANHNDTAFAGFYLAPGEDRVVDLNVPNIPDRTLFEYTLRLHYLSGDLRYEFEGSQPLIGTVSPAQCSGTGGAACSSNDNCCVAASLSCQAGTCKACYGAMELCGADEECCTGSCRSVFMYSACCIPSGQACQAGGFPPPVPCCGATCSAGVCP